MIKYFSIFSLCFLLACKGDQTSNTSSDTATKTIAKSKSFNSDGKVVSSGSVNEDGSYSYNIPAPEDAWSKEQVETALGLQAGSIYQLKANGKPTNRQRSCFYKITDPNMPNAAIVLQISGNPLPDEHPDWASYYIANLRADGEKSAEDPTSTLHYDEFPFGVSGVGSAELAKYYWRDKNELIYMLAFNVDKTEKEINTAAYQLAGAIAERNDQ